MCWEEWHGSTKEHMEIMPHQNPGRYSPAPHDLATSDPTHFNTADRAKKFLWNKCIQTACLNGFTTQKISHIITLCIVHLLSHYWETQSRLEYAVHTNITCKHFLIPTQWLPKRILLLPEPSLNSCQTSFTAQMLCEGKIYVFNNDKSWILMTSLLPAFIPWLCPIQHPAYYKHKTFKVVCSCGGAYKDYNLWDVTWYRLAQSSDVSQNITNFLLDCMMSHPRK
jgi:hypothetical protein